VRSDSHFRPNFESLRVEIPPNGECRCRRPRKPSLSFSTDADRERGGKGLGGAEGGNIWKMF
jgi:hypothetical protein